MNCLWVQSCLQAVAQELSGFVNSVKVRMTEEGTMSALTSVMKLCTQSAVRKNKVRLCMMLKGHNLAWPSSHTCRPYLPLLSFLLQDKVSPVSSSFSIMILPASLLSELAEICKLLVSDAALRRPTPEGENMTIHICLPSSSTAIPRESAPLTKTIAWTMTGM